MAAQYCAGGTYSYAKAPSTSYSGAMALLVEPCFYFGGVFGPKYGSASKKHPEKLISPSTWYIHCSCWAVNQLWHDRLKQVILCEGPRCHLIGILNQKRKNIRIFFCKHSAINQPIMRAYICHHIHSLPGFLAHYTDKFGGLCNKLSSVFYSSVILNINTSRYRPSWPSWGSGGRECCWGQHCMLLSAQGDVVHEKSVAHWQLVSSHPVTLYSTKQVKKMERLKIWT